MKLLSRRMGRPNVRFRGKVMLSFFVVIGFASLVMGYSFYRIMRGELETATLQRLERLTSQTAGTLDLHLKTVENIGRSYFSDSSLQRFLDSGAPSFEEGHYFRNKLDVQARQNPTLSAIAVKRLNGERLASPYYYNPAVRAQIDAEFARLEPLARALDGPPLWTVSLTTPKNTLQPAWSISYVQLLKRITPHSQHPVGYLKIDLDPDVLHEVFRGLQSGDGGSYVLVDADGTVMFAEDNARIGRSLEGAPVFAAYTASKTEAGEAQSFYYRFREGKESYIGFYHKLNYGGWMLLGSAPLSRVMHNVNAFGRTVAGIALAVFAASMLAASAIAAGVTRPLKVLNQKMKQVEIGDLQAFIDVRGSDEFATIQHSFNKMTAEIRTLISRVYEAELLKKEAEIKALQAQINPHFLYNTLGAIDSIASLGDDARIGGICQALGRMLRYNLDGGSFATAREEAEHLDHYLSIYEIRFDGQFRYTIDVDDRLLAVIMPKFLLQPLVENAVIHGLEGKRGDKLLTVAIRDAGAGRFEIVVADNGVGIEPDALRQLKEMPRWQAGGSARRETAPRATIGLANVYRRIGILYGGEPEIRIDSEPGRGTRIAIVLPYERAGGVAG